MYKNRSVSPNAESKEFFVLKARGKELLVRMLDQSQKSIEMLKVLKQKKDLDMDRPGNIKQFVKD